ncbi:MAG: type II toxin-antitoxin system Phd/YefM family antitoxin [Candidatus Devosia phytovorans]|uniref:Antitoxin n=1 Tax=Candidatus Devosia phytovorans TaxID=3121372 RepID=A0AAJ5VS61_9HYPH|nr:type II toxin-antitoxin system Phd/YefM family antitoxin [Devosia sp.]WEK02702.1 MAG: type II toxin-antitoxin system Phd/YefM family antitoxin [Devosia sp.]
MAVFNATDAKNKFGQVLEMAQAGPVRIQKNGRDVGIMLSPEQYEQMKSANAAPQVRPLVEELLERSIQRRRSLYEALAK